MSNEDNAGQTVMRTVNLHKSYHRGVEVPVLRGVDFDVHQGEFVSIVGSSGSGKSTLLQLMGLLDSPSSGEIYWKEERIDNRSPRFRDRFRNDVVGFIFQFYHLLPELTALENVMLPAMIHNSIFGYWAHRRRIRQEAEELLANVGLGDRMEHKPIEMSGGEMQRAAIARALLGGPDVLLADEPTGNLDTETGESVLGVLEQLRKDVNLTIVMVTHDDAIASRADRCLRLADGVLEGNRSHPERLPVVA